MFDPEEKIREAFELQERIKKQRKELKANEGRLRTLLEVLDLEHVTRAGDYERRQKISCRRTIISESFRARWPEHFNRLAKVTLKDALRELPEAEIEECCQVEEQITWEIVSHKLPGGD
ncbi:Uncharacterised protein [uncultured archaeon]|nr:Uncharacterised protein [uncultured archaeon]